MGLSRRRPVGGLRLRVEPQTMAHLLSCRLLDDACTGDDLTTVTERAKACARKWDNIVWRTRQKKSGEKKTEIKNKLSTGAYPYWPRRQNQYRLIWRLSMFSMKNLQLELIRYRTQCCVYSRLHLWSDGLKAISPTERKWVFEQKNTLAPLLTD